MISAILANSQVSTIRVAFSPAPPTAPETPFRPSARSKSYSYNIPLVESTFPASRSSSNVA
jgi:hypothetical protein